MSEEIIYRTVPIVAMRGSVVFPHTDSFLSFGRRKSIEAVNEAFKDDRVIAIFNQIDPKLRDPKKEDLYEMGTIATISQMMSSEDEVHTMVRGQARIKLSEIIANEPYMVGKVYEVAEEDAEGTEVAALAREVANLFKKSVNLGKGVDIPTIMRVLSNRAEVIEIADSVAGLLDIKTEEKQQLLETVSVRDRLKKILELLSHEVNVLDLERIISSKTQKRFEDQMKKAMLREKKKTIEAELGEDEEENSENEVTEYKNKIKAAKMPKDVRYKALKELKRLSKMSIHNPEGGYIRNYLDWLTDIPWQIDTSTKVSVTKAEKILNNDHYALDKAKERILEFLSVMKLKEEQNKKRSRLKKNKKTRDNGSHPTILCFVGPPGVGKTSIGKSIAHALERKFVRMSLGGIRDEAEIRGHRRTYVGAMPGRIIQGLKNAGTRNPVFMLDEVDKLGMDYRGDPASALLEILDPEQNREFSDHYLEVPYDLSEVMFICTANVLDTIPLPLRDRMEIITFAGYIEDEKYNIAKRYLWPKQLRVNGVSDLNIDISDAAIREIIKRYTREAGVRELERSLATVCRKIARKVAEKQDYPKLIEVADIHTLLGPEKFRSQIAGEEDEVGMTTGLAVTQAGGEILFVEVSLMPGKGKLTLTGQLGSVMRESAKAALTWAKSHWEELGLREDFGKKLDVHIHVPEGATKKDGPSAGIAMTTALVSALTKMPVKRYVGMTGEVTLRGRVLEIGGVKEKTVAGHRAGLKTIILPRDNKKDMEDIPDDTKKDINFVFADNMDEVLSVAIKGWPPRIKSNGKKSIHPPAYIASA
jgi:ATP-dependent Lon protease